MATRLYLVASTAPSISPTFDAGWTSTTGAVRRMMATTQAATTEQVTSDIGATGPAYTLSGQFVSPPLAAQAITGTTTITTRGRELASTDNVNKRARSVRVYSSDGATLRGTLSAWAATSSITELSATTLQGQATATVAALTSVTCQAGDILVVELGYGVGTSGTTPQALMEWGGTGTDHANNNSDTTGSVPWVEFSQDLTFQSGPATVTGTAVGNFGFTATAAGVREVQGAATAPLGFTATAAGVRQVPGAAAAAFGFTAAAAGVREVQGAAVAALGFTATASGVGSAGPGQVFGSATAALGFSATAAGVRTVAGAATATLGFAATGQAIRTVLGLGVAPLGFTATAAGVVSSPGVHVTRPNTGTVARPAAGTVTRPDTGVVTHAGDIIARPDTGTVTRP